MTYERVFVLVSGIVFALMALLHAIRLAFRWQVRLESRVVPMRVSVLGFALAAAMCLWAFWLLT